MIDRGAAPGSNPMSFSFGTLRDTHFHTLTFAVKCLKSSGWWYTLAENDSFMRRMGYHEEITDMESEGLGRFS